MRLRTFLITSVLFATTTLAFVSAHPFTVIGKVAAFTDKTISVDTTDPATKRPATRTFTFDKFTDIYRGKSKVSIADARIQKGEPVTITGNLDDEMENYAEEIRLQARK